jgi:hypothetical protein
VDRGVGRRRGLWLLRVVVVVAVGGTGGVVGAATEIGGDEDGGD